MQNRISRSGEGQVPIAIIGIGGRYPGAETLEALHRNLCDGVDSIGPLRTERRESSDVPADQNQVTGHLSRVDLFDYEFFGISRGEAEHMDPQHRVMLETACAVIQGAGYSLREFRGSRTAVVLAAPHSGYYLKYLLGKTNSASVFGNAPAMMAARITYLLDLRGPAMMIDTTCSSSLMAVHEACAKLWLGEADYALAGGVNLKMSFEAGAAGWGEEILAFDGRSKTFDARADGTGVGEGVGLVLLKPLAKALADRDQVHAVIVGSAANNDGARSNGMTAPSAEAQTDVVLTAWERAGVDPAQVGYVEVHGTGTKLGDPIEMRGLTRAFACKTDLQGFCAVSALKSNIGHCGYAAGVASLTKAVLALRYRKLYPTLHFEELNPLIKLDGSAVFINTELRDWRSAGGPRIAGVSSFGMAGTNVHVVLQEAPPQAVSQPRNASSELVTLSARNQRLLERYVTLLISSLQQSQADLHDVAFVLNAGRDDYSCRMALVAKDVQELVAALSERLASGLDVSTSARHELVFLCPGDMSVTRDQLSRLQGLHPAAAEAVDACTTAGADLENPQARTFVGLYASCRHWKALGASGGQFMGSGVGNFVIAALRGRTPLDEAIRQATVFRAEGAFDPEQIARALTKVQAAGARILVAPGVGSAFVQRVREGWQHSELHECPVDASREFHLEVLARLYCAGVDISWTDHYAESRGRRIELPAVPMQPTRCWLADAGLAAPGAGAISPMAALGRERAPRVEGLEVTASVQMLAKIWAEILNVDSLRCDVHFGDIGGDSLSALDVAARVREVFDVTLSPDDFQSHPRLSDLASRIDALRAGRAEGATTWSNDRV